MFVFAWHWQSSIYNTFVAQIRPIYLPRPNKFQLMNADPFIDVKGQTFHEAVSIGVQTN